MLLACLISQIKNYCFRYTHLSHGILHIYNVSRSDEGDYKCIAKNSLRSLPSSSVTFKLKDTVNALSSEAERKSMEFLNDAVNLTRNLKEDAIIECLPNYNAPDISVEWYRESGKLLPKDRFSILNRYTLVLKDIATEDEDVYICSVTINGEKKTLRNILTVHTPPTFITKPVNIVKPASQTSRLECSAYGSPPPSVRWLKNGEPLSMNGRIMMRTGSLVISQTVSSDSGVYQCIAENKAGVAMVAARLLVNTSSNQPKPPHNLKATTLSSSEIKLTWEAGHSPNGLIIQAYTVHYMPTEGGRESQKVAVDTSAIIDKLKPFTNYTFYVRAYNERSPSEQSESITQMTGEDTPVSIPLVSFVHLSSTSLLVSWETLPKDKARGKIISYSVHYRRQDQESYKELEVSDRETNEVILSDLQPGKKYFLRVIPKTSAGFPKIKDDSDWEWSPVEMPSDDADSFRLPLILHLTAINSTTIDVKWSLPRNFNISDVNIEGFQLSYRQQNKALGEPIKLMANTYRYFLTNLEPETWYEVHVAAFSKNGTGRETVQSIITLPERLKANNSNSSLHYASIQPPTELEARPLSATSIRFTWKQVNNNTVMYTVRYQKAYLNGLKKENVDYSEIRSTHNEVTVTDLKPYTVYEFSVSSHDANNNQGPFSEKIVCKTLEDVPTEPRDLSGVIIDSNTVRLTWEPPAQANGQITGYQILYTTIKHEKEFDKWNLKEENGLQLNAVVFNLSSNTQYYFCTRALTKAGPGPPSSLLTLYIPKKRPQTSTISKGLSVRLTPSVQFLGIVIGLAIGLAFIFICVFVVFCKIKLFSHPVNHYNGFNGSGRSNSRQNGQLPARFGEVFLERSAPEDGKEMDSFTTLLNDHYLDTKGGYTGIRMNGHCNKNVEMGAQHAKRKENYSSQASSLPLLNNHSMRKHNSKEDYRTVPFSSRLHYNKIKKKPTDSSACENSAPGRPAR
ncbi:protogenin-like protein [Dinothrombium tinctorium]|uniref:Protogenin-like protein n=1 Tax=Dinothrombium tinctorium TaxID=1965070 RepID=A0A3S3S4Q0_9ACAR|nr:protogenin-like protein [Dinothrombium tinctorium]RWS15701.1 protogenin-like protein [Dinothrombium tinctorium]